MGLSIREQAAVECAPYLTALCDFYRESRDGHQGLVADEYAVLTKALWSGQYRSVAPRDFRVRTDALQQYRSQQRCSTRTRTRVQISSTRTHRQSTRIRTCHNGTRTRTRQNRTRPIV